MNGVPSSVPGPGTAPGPRVLVVQHEEACPLALMGEPDALPGAVVDVVRPDLGQPLPVAVGRRDDPAGRWPGGYDAVVVLGGAMAAWDDAVAPWLPATRRLLAACVADGTPVLGICLGAQLLALATGGRVERGEAGPERGLVEVCALPSAGGDPLVRAVSGGGAPAPWPVVQSHGDVVTHLPPDAELLASSATYPVQAFRVGARAWGVQYHPEATPAVLARWLADDAEELAAEGLSAADLLAPVHAAADPLAEGARRHGRLLVDAVAERRAGPSAGAAR